MLRGCSEEPDRTSSEVRNGNPLVSDDIHLYPAILETTDRLEDMLVNLFYDHQTRLIKIPELNHRDALSKRRLADRPINVLLFGQSVTGTENP